jgi:2-deoxy-D-gluconate 3-dehydrogenase
VVADLDGSGAEKTAAMVKALGVGSIGLQGDVAEESHVQRMVRAAVDNFGKIDSLVSCAGVMILRPFLGVTTAEWERQMNTNLRGTFLCGQAVAREMIQHGGGAIVNFSSGAADGPPPTGSVYAATKAGIRLLTAGMAIDLAPYGIRVNAIAPGYIKTDMTRELSEDAAESSRLVRSIPLARAGEPEDIVGTVVYLLSDASSYVTGITVTIDGGLRAHG